jgi:serine/threonine protein kinase
LALHYLCSELSGIVHCDIKPDNLLVFQHDTNQYFIKVADFGYASPVTESGSVHLATPAAWTDPTYRGEALDANTAKKMESYSFGLVCAWLLREASIHRVSQNSGTPVSSAAQSAKPEDWSAVLAGISNLDADQIRNIRKFFSLTLAADRDQRSTDFPELIRLLEDIISPVADKDICRNLLDDAPPTASLLSLHTSTPSRSPNFQVGRLHKSDDQTTYLSCFAFRSPEVFSDYSKQIFACLVSLRSNFRSRQIR